jgi:hypothetical protein
MAFIIAFPVIVLATVAILWPTRLNAQSPTLVINEIDYDQPGSDTAEFIELKNVGAVTINLKPYAVKIINGEGGGATVVKTINLPDVNLPTGGYFVICADAANTQNCDKDVSPDSGLIQNGVPDAVALTTGTTVVDTVSYEGNTVAPYTEASGEGLVDEESLHHSGLSRFPDGLDTNRNNIDFSPRCITPGGPNTATTTGCEPYTAITLESFLAGWQTGGVLVQWATAAEIDNAGFNLHRAEDEGGPYIPITPALIPARGDPAAGAVYSYRDTAVVEGVTYFYKLEDIDLTGLSTFHGPITATPEVSTNPGLRLLYLPLIIK